MLRKKFSCMFKNPLVHRVDSVYSLFIRLGTFLQSLLLLYMRLTWGHQLYLAGTKKIMHIDQVVQLFSGLHIHYPVFSAYLVGYCEAIGGLLFILGFASRFAAIPIATIMITALSTAHVSQMNNLRFLHEPSAFVAQAPYPYLIAALLIFCFGPGKISLDAWIKRWASRQPKY